MPSAAMLNVKSGPQKGDLYTEKEWNTDSKDDQEGAYMHSKASLHFQYIYSLERHLHGQKSSSHFCPGADTYFRQNMRVSWRFSYDAPL